MDNLKKLRDKKKDSKMHPLEKKAKMEVMEHLQKMAQGAMGDKLKGMHKVTVASDSPQGLQTGLHKAEDVLGDGSEDMYAEGGMTETHPMEALRQAGQADPMKHMAEAEDDTHPDHENFLHSENKEDGEDGFSQDQDADGDHLLEMDEEAQHAKDEKEEGDDDAYAMGGEVTVNDDETQEQREEASGIPNYDEMDRSEMSAHLNELVAAMKRKGLA